MKTDVPLDVQCRDKFLLQSTAIKDDDSNVPLQDLVNFPIYRLTVVDENRVCSGLTEITQRHNPAEEDPLSVERPSRRKCKGISLWIVFDTARADTIYRHANEDSKWNPSRSRNAKRGNNPTIFHHSSIRKSPTETSIRIHHSSYRNLRRPLDSDGTGGTTGGSQGTNRSSHKATGRQFAK
jgi:hypothetical protein